MTDLAATEAAKYRRAWAMPGYRVQAHGLDLWRRERQVFPERVYSALDLGCGHGRLMAAWIDEGIDAYGVDIVDGLDPEIREKHADRLTVAPLWAFKARGFDLGVAADVLEHLPPEKVDQTLERIAEACRVLVAQTAEFPHRLAGLDLHPTVQGATWWRERMLAVGGGEVIEHPHAGGRGRKHLLVWRPARWIEEAA